MLWQCTERNFAREFVGNARFAHGEWLRFNVAGQKCLKFFCCFKRQLTSWFWFWNSRGKSLQVTSHAVWLKHSDQNFRCTLRWYACGHSNCVADKTAELKAIVPHFCICCLMAMVCSQHLINHYPLDDHPFFLQMVKLKVCKNFGFYFPFPGTKYVTLQHLVTCGLHFLGFSFLSLLPPIATTPYILIAIAVLPLFWLGKLQTKMFD